MTTLTMSRPPQRASAFAAGLALCASLGCGSKATIKAGPSFTVSGTIKLVNDTSGTTTPVADGQLGGSLIVVLFSTDMVGFCLSGTTQVLGYQSLPTTSVAELEGAGVPYSINVYATTALTYPLQIYPLAILLKSSTIFSACENNASGPPSYNAFGYYGLNQYSDYSLPSSLDVCCGVHPDPFVVSSAKITATGADLTLFPPKVPATACINPNTSTTNCVHRHAPPPNQAQDSACWTALGPLGPSLITDNGAPCP